MRMMKNNNNETVMVIGIDHGYGNMKTATRCFPSGVARYDKEPIFQNNLLVYNGMYYQIGEEHKEFCAEKTQDEDYYVLTLAAIARELDGKGMNQAKVHIAAGLPLTWVATQKEEFLERVETAIRDGVKESVPMAMAKNLLEMLVPFVKESVGEINLPERTLTMEKTDGEIAEDNPDWEKEADMDAALDFADSF